MIYDIQPALVPIVPTAHSPYHSPWWCISFAFNQESRGGFLDEARRAARKQAAAAYGCSERNEWEPPITKLDSARKPAESAGELLDFHHLQKDQFLQLLGKAAPLL